VVTRPLHDGPILKSGTRCARLAPLDWSEPKTGWWASGSLTATSSRTEPNTASGRIRPSRIPKKGETALDPNSRAVQVSRPLKATIAIEATVAGDQKVVFQSSFV